MKQITTSAVALTSLIVPEGQDDSIHIPTNVHIHQLFFSSIFPWMLVCVFGTHTHTHSRTDGVR